MFLNERMRLYNNQGQLCSLYSGKTKSAALCLTKAGLEAQSQYFIMPLPQRKKKSFHSVSVIVLPFLKWRKDNNK